MNTKQVIVMRKDLNMRKGKMVAQGSHASIAFLTKRLKSKEPLTEAQNHWLENSFVKICVSVDSEQSLLEVYEKATSLGLECHLITDNGQTEFSGIPTRTCLAIGPDWVEKIDPVTENLRLL